MWADRIGIGLAALVLLGGLVVGALDSTKKDQTEQAAEYAAEVARCNSLPPMSKEHKNSSGQDVEDIFRWAARIGCPPDEPTPIPDKPIGDYMGRLIAFMVLPIWVILRIVDFMFGGPARRRMKRA